MRSEITDTTLGTLGVPPLLLLFGVRRRCCLVRLSWLLMEA
jgi:hypothetical protein